MQTQILKLEDTETIAEACQLLDNEQVIAAPTDTVYGLFCRFDSPIAIQRLYDAKMRPATKAIPVLISQIDQLTQVISMPPPRMAHKLMAEFWPGPLTIIMSGLDTLPSILTANQTTIAVRMPDHQELRNLLDITGPLAATSANISDGPETHSATKVLAQLDGRIPLVLESDHELGIQSPASTIIDLSDKNQPRILRPGPVAEAVRKVLNL